MSSGREEINFTSPRAHFMIECLWQMAFCSVFVIVLTVVNSQRKKKWNFLLFAAHFYLHDIRGWFLCLRSEWFGFVTRVKPSTCESQLCLMQRTEVALEVQMKDESFSFLPFFVCLFSSILKHLIIGLTSRCPDPEKQFQALIKRHHIG